MMPAGNACCIYGAVLAASVHHKLGAAVKGCRRLPPLTIRSCLHSSFAANIPPILLLIGICDRYAPALLPFKPLLCSSQIFSDEAC